MRLIHTKSNKTVTNSGNENFCFTINGQLKTLLSRFRYFQFSYFNMTFVKSFMRKLEFSIKISKILLKFYYDIKF